MGSDKQGFKKTEIGLIPEDWEIISLSKAILINPKRELKKGALAKKISMDNLESFNKKIKNYEIATYNGGSKFINEDTLLARITPCLENGKTAFVDILSESEVAFGSTEFIVLSELKNKTVNDYVYYLAISPRIRTESIKSMTGTSGRQRIQIDLIQNIEISIPPLPEQKAIAKVLSDLDEKIELNNEMNKTLEEIGQALFKRWFIDFEFPNENGNPYRSSGGEMIFSKELGKENPKGWEVKRLKELAKLEMGISPRGSSYNSIGDGLPLLNGAADFDGKSIKPNKYTSSPTKTCKENDIIFCIRGTIGNLTFSDSIYCIGRGVSAISPCKDEYREFIFLYLNQYLDKLIKNAFGSVILGLSKEDINSLLIILPSENTIKLFHNIVLKLNNLLKNNNTQSKILSEIRDSLLPKLMSGEIRVPLEASQ